MESFNQGLEFLLSSWPSLQLTLQNHTTDSHLRHELLINLKTSLLEYFQEYGHQIEEEDLEAFYDAFFEDVFEVMLDDGSVEQRSKLTHTLYHECLNGQNQTLKYLEQLQKKFEQKPIQVSKIENSVEVSDNESNDEEDQEMQVDEVERVQHNTAASVPRSQPDEDGWISVTRKKKHR